MYNVNGMQSQKMKQYVSVANCQSKYAFTDSAESSLSDRAGRAGRQSKKTPAGDKLPRSRALTVWRGKYACVQI